MKEERKVAQVATPRSWISGEDVDFYQLRARPSSRKDTASICFSSIQRKILKQFSIRSSQSFDSSRPFPPISGLGLIWTNLCRSKRRGSYLGRCSLSSLRRSLWSRSPHHLTLPRLLTSSSNPDISLYKNKQRLTQSTNSKSKKSYACSDIINVVIHANIISL